MAGALGKAASSRRCRQDWILANRWFRGDTAWMTSRAENHDAGLHGSEVGLIDAELRAGAFSPHRHDTYTIAVTTAGVQSFNYLGQRWQSLPGQAVILHPDEVHDGYCSNETGFSYRAAYLPPAHIQTVIGGAALPFLADGVSTDAGLVASALHLIAMCTTEADRFGYQDALHRFVGAMQRCEGRRPPARRKVNREAVMRVREFLDSVPAPGTNLDQLEELAGYDRWQLSRDFRALLGTSPYRYLQCRRLERAGQLLRGGHGMAAAAHEAGFADQSHFGRVFRRTFGTTPLAWHRSGQTRTIVL